VTSIAVITPVAGRRAHLRLQQQGLGRSEESFAHRVIVAMGEPPDDELEPGDVLVHVDVDGNLPLARARNRGAEVAMTAGAELLIFLDVDCVPSPRMVGRYLEASDEAPGDLLCGPVHYLDPPSANGYDLDELPSPTGHPARPVPAANHLVRKGDHELFWSLSFAVTARTWREIGGFDECYEGYGGEDTDFGQRAKARGVELTWVGGAWSFHQHHPTNDPPTQHLRDILRNAELFRDRWGWWPMSGWLGAFESAGLIGWNSEAQRWLVTANG
jgi:GT2 family glycosyltransferase